MAFVAAFHIKSVAGTLVNEGYCPTFSICLVQFWNLLYLYKTQTPQSFLHSQHTKHQLPHHEMGTLRYINFLCSRICYLMFQVYCKIRPSIVWKNVNSGSSFLQGMHWRYQLQSMWLQMWLYGAVYSIILCSCQTPFLLDTDQYARLSSVLYECCWNESPLWSVKRECIRKIP
jgi:hypothetical protein